MKRTVLLLPLLTIVVMIGCGDRSNVDVQNAAGDTAFTLDFKPQLDLEQGEEQQFNLVLKNQIDLNAGFDFEFKNLPEGVTIDGDTKRGSGTKRASFTFKVAESAPLIANHPLSITVNSPGVASKTVTMQITIKESTRKKQQAKDAFVKGLRATYDAAKTDLSTFGKKASDDKIGLDEQKKLAEMRVKLLGQATDVEKSINDLDFARLEDWAKDKDKAKKAVDDFKSAVKKELDAVMKLLEGK